jgi:hypothetical protein
METLIKVNLRMEKLMATEFKSGLMGKSMMANGRRVWGTEWEFGVGLKEIIHILENGKGIKLRDMELTLGQMVILMKVSGTQVWNMEREQTFSAMEILTMVSIKRVSHMEQEYIPGVTAVNMMENFQKV